MQNRKPKKDIRRIMLIQCECMATSGASFGISLVFRKTVCLPVHLVTTLLMPNETLVLSYSSDDTAIVMLVDHGVSSTTNSTGK